MEGTQSKIMSLLPEICLLVDLRQDTLKGLLYREGLLGQHPTQLCKTFQQ